MEAASGQQPKGFWDDAEVIHSYTRGQAIEDGVLVDVSKMASEAGFKWPVAVTRAVWDGYVVPDQRSRPYGQSEDGRLWDLLWMLLQSVKRGAGYGGCIMFSLYFVMKERKLRLVELKCMSGAGDSGEGTLTVMLPDED